MPKIRHIADRLLSIVLLAEDIKFVFQSRIFLVQSRPFLLKSCILFLNSSKTLHISHGRKSSVTLLNWTARLKRSNTLNMRATLWGNLGVWEGDSATERGICQWVQGLMVTYLSFRVAPSKRSKESSCPSDKYGPFSAQVHAIPRLWGVSSFGDWALPLPFLKISSYLSPRGTLTRSSAFSLELLHLRERATRSWGTKLFPVGKWVRGWQHGGRTDLTWWWRTSHVLQRPPSPMRCEGLRSRVRKQE